MNLLLRCFFTGLVSVSVSAHAVSSFFEISTKDIRGKEYKFAQHKGKVIIAANTASQCGYTPQLKGLQSLYKKYQKKGLVVIAFPSSDFKQELAEPKAIESFAQKEFEVTFPLMDKASVRGAEKQPAFQFLTQADFKKNPLTAEVAWNFEKFIVGKDGQVAARFKSSVSPESPEFIAALEKELSK